MSNNEQPEQPQGPPPRQASPQTVIVLLNQRLDQKAQEARQHEDQIVALSALCSDLTNENAAMTAANDQLKAENEELRERLGLSPDGALSDPEEAGPSGRQPVKRTRAANGR